MAPMVRDVSDSDSAVDDQGAGESDERTYQNVGGTERLVSAMLGGALLLRSVIKPSGLGSELAALLGVGLLHRSATGHCAAYQALGVNTAKKAIATTIGHSVKAML
ncbi:MAG TPA: DUF2892 domain-containing protein [Nitrospiraceae bacterium]|nr:DUF2892 domain-containing protein [Nitrospiraceae bacterium]